jgi:hypothetical protein
MNDDEWYKGQEVILVSENQYYRILTIKKITKKWVYTSDGQRWHNKGGASDNYGLNHYLAHIEPLTEEKRLLQFKKGELR